LDPSIRLISTVFLRQDSVREALKCLPDSLHIRLLHINTFGSSFHCERPLCITILSNIPKMSHPATKFLKTISQILSMNMTKSMCFLLITSISYLKQILRRYCYQTLYILNINREANTVIYNAMDSYPLVNIHL
jgi:hypothetical protein